MVDAGTVEKEWEYSYTFSRVNGNIVFDIMYLLFAIQR